MAWLNHQPKHVVKRYGHSFIKQGATHDSGKTDADREKRAGHVVDRASKVLAFVDDNPTITVSAVMQYLDATIDWSALDLADRMLIKDILTIVEADLSAHETSNPLINVRELLGTVIDAALLYGR
mgnify:CR=1 FL=1